MNSHNCEDLRYDHYNLYRISYRGPNYEEFKRKAPTAGNTDTESRISSILLRGAIHATILDHAMTLYFIVAIFVSTVLFVIASQLA